MSHLIPTTQQALVIKGNGASLQSVPVPKLNSGEILIKVESVAINPTDWKHIDFHLGKDGAIVGCDVAGEVVAIADEGIDKDTDIRIGDQVFAINSGASIFTPEVGAFSQYTKIKANRALKVGNKLVHAEGDHVKLGPVTTWEGAASLPVSIITNLIAFQYCANIPLNELSQLRYASEYLLVWGGASSLGQIAIQFGKRAGFKVIATASKHNFEILKELGAEKIFDYHDQDVIEQISKYSGDGITLAFDTISEPPTTIDVYSLLSKNKESMLITSLDWDKSTVKEVNPHVTSEFPLAYLTIDKKKKFVRFYGVDIFDSPDGLFESNIEIIKEVNALWAKDPNFIRHMPVRILPGGLNGLHNALDIVRQGKYSGAKIVLSL